MPKMTKDIAVIVHTHPKILPSLKIQAGHVRNVVAEAFHVKHMQPQHSSELIAE